MVHLLPLPGSPRWEPPGGGSAGSPADGMARVLERARADAEALVAGGIDALMVENFGDVPFVPGAVPAETCAAMTRAVLSVMEVAAGRPVGINVLRNDAATALGIAAATGASFIRVNVHVGSMFTDQGLLHGAAHHTLRNRRALGLVPGSGAAGGRAGTAEPAPRGVLIAADVQVKHATPPAGASLEDAARDATTRGLADLLIVSGSGTSQPTDPERLRRVREAVPGVPLWVGSGVTPATVGALLAVADGAIVGSALQAGGRAGQPVERARVEALVEAAQAARGLRR